MEFMQSPTTTTHSGNTAAHMPLSGGKEGLMASTTSILTIAATHAAANSSAEFCLRDAREQVAAGNDEAARRWALRSLSHSVGMFHADYQRAAA